jgi:hypothetical protein
MTIRQFFIGRAIVCTILVLIAIVYVIYSTVITKPKHVETVRVVNPTVPSAVPAFSWQTEKANENNLDGLPKTHVYVEATHANGKREKKLVDTPDGGCNALQESEPDSIAGTTVFQCYAAGFGYRYKITKGESSYLVMRKGFEEGSPEYTPKEQGYEKVAEFSFE